MNDVPCHGCTLCCRHGADYGSSICRRVPLIPEEVGKFKQEIYNTPDGPVPVIAVTKRGDCVYLTEKGCSIHGDKPVYCQNFDCRDLPRMFSRAMARERSRYRGRLFYQVWQKGFSLLKEHEKNKIEKK